MTTETEEKPMKVEVLHSSEAYLAQVKAEVDIQIATAKRYPRVVSQCIQKIKDLATLDPETAEACWYVLPRAGDKVQGPSVRLAEIVASSWGNIRVGTKIVGIDDTHVTTHGLCHDLETNVAIQMEVKRRITNKHGKRFSEDMITTTSMAASSIALRNAIFKVVPMAIFKNVIEEIRRVGMGKERSLVESRNAALTWFKGQGITKEQILSLLSRMGESEIKDTEDIGVKEVQLLRGVITAVNEETTTMEEAFAEVKEEKEIKEGKTEFGKKKGKEKEKDEKEKSDS